MENPVVFMPFYVSGRTKQHRRKDAGGDGKSLRIFIPVLKRIREIHRGFIHTREVRVLGGLYRSRHEGIHRRVRETILSDLRAGDRDRQKRTHPWQAPEVLFGCLQAEVLEGASEGGGVGLL